MKKLLSLILAMMLVVGMLPVAFAGETATSTDPLEYVTTLEAVKEDVKTTATTAGHIGSNGALISKQFTTYIATYDAMDSSKTDLWAFNNSLPGSSEKNMTAARMMLTCSEDRLSSDQAFLALKLKVEQTGWYDLSFLAAQSEVGVDVEVRFGQSTRATLAPTYKTQLPVVGSAVTYLEDASGSTFDHKYDVGRVYVETAGDYFIYFDCNDHDSTTSATQYFYLSQITLTPVLPDSIAGLPASITVDEEATSDAITATVKDASGNTLEGAIVTYSIDNDTVATVDAATGAVTGVKKGSATVTATVTGYDVTATIPVTVNGEEEPPVEPDDSINYIITWNSMKTVPTATVTDFTAFDTYEEMNNEYPLWAFNNVYVSGGSKNFIGTRMMIVTSEDSINKGNAFLNLKLKVENPGWYDLSVLVADYMYGMGADVYLGKANRATWAPVYAYELNKIGHIETYVENGSAGTFNSPRDVGKVYIPEAGDYFIAFIFTNGGHTNPDRSRQGFYLSQITLDPTTAPVVESESVTAKDDTVTVSVEGYETIDGIDNPTVVNQVNLGTTVTVTAAEEKEGKAFAGWYRGGENGVFVSKETSYTFNAFTNFTLKAVYDDAEEVAEGNVDVEFYKQDGTYLGKESVAVGTEGSAVSAPSASLIGHSFVDWYVNENTTLAEVETITKLTRAVATFTAKTLDKDTYGSLLYDGRLLSTTYGAKIPMVNEDATFWMRDGKVIAYGDTYEFYRWGKGNIVACTGEVDVKPVVYLDDDTIDDAYMIEYDKGNSTRVVEAGIIFSNSAESTVGSYNGERYVSQRNADHGQLAAAPSGDYAYARGYLICETASGYEVIHTDSVAID